MKRIICLCLTVGLMLLALPSVAGVTWRPKAHQGLPTGATIQAGPLRIDAHLTTPRPVCDDECGTIEPADFNVGPPLVGYFYTPAGRGQQRRSDITSVGGAISTEGSRVIELFIMPDDRWNVAKVIVRYGRRLVASVPGDRTTSSDVFGHNGYRVSVGALNGVRLLTITVEYENLNSKLIGRRTDCITVDAQRFQ